MSCQCWRTAMAVRSVPSRRAASAHCCSPHPVGHVPIISRNRSSSCVPCTRRLRTNRCCTRTRGNGGSAHRSVPAPGFLGRGRGGVVPTPGFLDLAFHSRGRGRARLRRRHHGADGRARRTSVRPRVKALLEIAVRDCRKQRRPLVHSARRGLRAARKRGCVASHCSRSRPPCGLGRACAPAGPAA